MTTATFINRQAKQAQRTTRAVVVFAPAFINAMPKHDDNRSSALLEMWRE